MCVPPYAMRLTFCAFIAIAVLTALYALHLRLVSQIHYLKAMHYTHSGHYDSAVNHLKTSIRFQDNNPLIWKNMGRAYHNLAVSQPIKDAFLFGKKAKNAYLKAIQLNPLDGETVYGLAREEALLEQIQPYLRHIHPDQHDVSYNALPYFQQAVRLRPNGIRYHFAMARYLKRNEKTEAFLQAVSNLVRIYPPAYRRLKKEELWSPEINEAVKKGLNRALDEGTALGAAHIAMSSLLEKEKDWVGSINHYQKAFTHQAIVASTGNYFYLGRLYLENGQFEEAEKIFLRALSMSRDREKDLDNLYAIYKRKGGSEAFYRFYNRVAKNFPMSAQTDVLLARTFIDLKQYHHARRLLQDLNRKAPEAEAYFWLAHIAEVEKDWDSMELAIQKATTRDPENSRYHFIFSTLLIRRKKLERAEKEAMLAIKHSAKPSSRLFSHRARIRWSRKDYPGAAKDWESAIAVKPKDASLFAQAAEAYNKLGEWSRAITYYKQAMSLDSKNDAYRKRYDVIRGAPN